MAPLTLKQMLTKERDPTNFMAERMELLYREYEKNLKESIASLRKEFDGEKERLVAEIKERLSAIEKADPKYSEIINKAIDSAYSQVIGITKGDKPLAGVDYPIPQNGKDYIFTEKDREEIVKRIPKIERIIREKPVVTERVEKIIEKPTLQTITKEMEALEIATKLNTKEEIVEMDVIKGLKKYLTNLKKSLAPKGGGMGNVVPESFSVDTTTTSITLANGVASAGAAIWLNYQGQQQQRGVHFTSNGAQQIPLLFTPDNGTVIDVIYIRG